MTESAYSIEEAPPSIAPDKASNLVKLSRAPDVDKSYHTKSTSSKPLSTTSRSIRSANGSVSAVWPLLWESESAVRQGEPGNVITSPPEPGRLRPAYGCRKSRIYRESCGYPDFTIQHIGNK